MQFQKDELLYERLFGESLLYFYRNRSRFIDWQAVVIYPSRSTEQKERYPYRSLLHGGQTHLVYLDELGDASQLPIEVALVLLTTTTERQAPSAARELLARAEQEALEVKRKRTIIEMVVTIMSYQFTTLSRSEVEAMLNIRFQETQVYKDIKQEVLDEAREEIREQVRQEEARNLVLRLLTRRLGNTPSEETRSQIAGLPLLQLEQLSEDLLDFTTMTDLDAWLTARRGF